MVSRRSLFMPVLIVGLALVFYFVDQSEKEPRLDNSQSSTQQSGMGEYQGNSSENLKVANSTLTTPVPMPLAGSKNKDELKPLFLPGTRSLNPEAWSGTGAEIPSFAAARRLAAVKWDQPRKPFAGEDKLPDPDGIGPCPPRNCKDTPVVKRYIEPQSFAPTWIHKDGSFTKLRLAVVETAGRKQILLNIVVGTQR